VSAKSTITPAGRSGNVIVVDHSFEPQTESGTSARPIKNDLVTGAAKGGYYSWRRHFAGYGELLRETSPGV